MKSLNPRLAIPVLAALVLAGCNQSPSSQSAEMAATNSSMSLTNGMMDGPTNMPVINSVPEINTNLPATNSLPNINTNIGSTNQ